MLSCLVQHKRKSGYIEGSGLRCYGKRELNGSGRKIAERRNPAASAMWMSLGVEKRNNLYDQDRIMRHRRKP